jgi:Glycosyl-hydrolase 97 N-terminal
MKCRIASGTASFLRLASLCLLPWGAPPVALADDAAGLSDPVVVQSPDGRLEIELFTRAASGAPSQLQYRVSLSDRAVVDASNLGVRLKEGAQLGRDCVVVGHESIRIDSSFEQYPGKRRHVIDLATETTLVLRERGAKPLEWRAERDTQPKITELEMPGQKWARTADDGYVKSKQQAAVQARNRT